MTRRGGWWPVAVAVGLLVPLSACTDPGDGTQTPGPVSGSSTAPGPSPTTGPATIVVPVYYAADTGTGTDLRLVREFRALPDPGGAALTAARAVLAGEPLDPDYRNPAGEVRSVSTTDGTVELDLSTAATVTTTGSAGAGLAVQALVYSVTGALQSDDPVRLLVEGSPVDELFGVLDTSGPIPRDDPLSVRLLVQINEPNQGDVVGPDVTVSEEAAVFGATLPWQVRTPDGEGGPLEQDSRAFTVR